MVYQADEADKALTVIMEMLDKCIRIQPKFAKNTAPYTLLKNRIKALTIAGSLLAGRTVKDDYQPDELAAAWLPLSFIIRKCQKAQLKHDLKSRTYRQLQEMIAALSYAEALIR
ncbi:hypothetical protein SDC9_94517 [bioreactor metagenome]|uniref:Uncharacterized protein n=1 Tax=bioreactor metagenome TaxID=1076179 RepID=A0A645A3N6_9ZZZZ